MSNPSDALSKRSSSDVLSARAARQRTTTPEENAKTTKTPRAATATSPARSPKTGGSASTIKQQDPAERRRHARVALTAKARFLKESGEEEPCLVVNISAGGAMLKAKNPPPTGANVILYIDDVGRFEGRVIRSGRFTFAVDYRSRRAKIRRTADALTRALNTRPLGLDKRGAPRIREESAAIVTFADGETIEAAILDISLTGASIGIEPRPPLGAAITVGKMSAKVVRRHDRGVGVVFTGPAKGMEDVIEKTKAQNETDKNAVEGGAFGKKGLDA